MSVSKWKVILVFKEQCSCFFKVSLKTFDQICDTCIFETSSSGLKCCFSCQWKCYLAFHPTANPFRSQIRVSLWDSTSVNNGPEGVLCWYKSTITVRFWMCDKNLKHFSILQSKYFVRLSTEVYNLQHYGEIDGKLRLVYTIKK